jgi:hypothetical protein
MLDAIQTTHVHALQMIRVNRAIQMIRVILVIRVIRANVVFGTRVAFVSVTHKREHVHSKVAAALS